MKISEFSSGRKLTAYGDCAGDVVRNAFAIALLAADLTLNQKIDIGILPAGHTVVDAVLVSDDLDSNAAPTITLDVGLLSGEVGVDDNARTVGTELFSASNVAQAGGVARTTSKSAFTIAPSDTDRSVGVLVKAAPATAQAGTLTLVLLTAPAG